MAAPAPLVDATVARLMAEVPELGQVRRAADFEALLSSKTVPQTAIAAFVVPRGLRADSPSRASGVHDQNVSRRVSVVVFLRVGDPLGNRLLDTVEDFMGSVIVALAGWAPPGDMRDPYALQAVDGPRPYVAGTFYIEFTFAARDRLRVFL